MLNALNDAQAALVTGLLDTQSTALNNIVAKRREISEKLRLFMNGASVNKDEVVELVREYGEYDGEMVYYYAANFVQVGNSLTGDQAAALMDIRLDYYERFPDYQADWKAYDCHGAWLYADRIEMPTIENTDFLFDGTAITTYESVTQPGAALEELATGFQFAEGPAADAQGNLFFSDITANRIYKLSTRGELSVFSDRLNGPNGLFFDGGGNLLACEGGNGRLVSLDSGGNINVIVDVYNRKGFNEPNDLWIDPKGGIYFSDPVYFSNAVQDGEHVYYLSPDGNTVTRVIGNMSRPNGVIGAADGALLYVTDHGADRTYVYDINADGTLANKTLFASEGSDGMTIDNEGNVYLTRNHVQVYNALGTLIEIIETPEAPTNLCFGGGDKGTLFITTKSALYSIKMQVTGINASGTISQRKSKPILRPYSPQRPRRIFLSR